LKTVYLSIFFLCLFCAITAADDRTQDSSLIGNPTYRKSCAKCHGKTAQGRHFGGPSLISEKVSGASVGDLRTIITNGKGRMPKFAGKLADADIDRLLMEIKGANQQ
jgi:mono/diheme cytochrome c family protein